MRRREFITLVGGVAAWPFAASAQQPAAPIIGILDNASPAAQNLAAFKQGLKETGYIDGQNVAIDTVPPRVNMIGYRRSQPIWSAVKWQ